MDLATVVVIFVAGLLALGATVYMLNRAWGDFPRRVGPPAAGLAPPPLAPPPDDDEDAWGEAEPGEADPPLPAGAPEGELIPVTHPMVRRAVEGALAKGGSPYATYFIRHGDQIYLAAYRIADPIQRARVARLFQELNGGDVSSLDFAAMLKAIQTLGK